MSDSLLAHSAAIYHFVNDVLAHPLVLDGDTISARGPTVERGAYAVTRPRKFSTSLRSLSSVCCTDSDALSTTWDDILV